MEIVNYSVAAFGDDLDRLKWDISPYETIKKRVRLFTKPNEEVNRRKLVLSSRSRNGSPRFNLVNFTFNFLEKESSHTRYTITGSTGLSYDNRFCANPIHKSGLKHILIELSFNFPDILFKVCMLAHNNIYITYIKDRELYDHSRNHVFRFNKDHKEEGDFYLHQLNISNGNLYIDGGYRNKLIILPNGEKSLKAIQPEEVVSIPWDKKLTPVCYFPMNLKIMYRDSRFITVDANSLDIKNREWFEKQKIDLQASSTTNRYHLKPSQDYLIINSLGVVDSFVTDSSSVFFNKELNYWRIF